MVATTVETLTVDGINLKTLAYNIDTLAATLSMPQKRGSNTIVAQRDGSIWTPYKVADQGSYVLPMWVRGTDVDGAVPGGSTRRKEFFKRIDELTRLFGKDYALLDVRHTLPDLTVRRALCEVTEAINFATGPEPVGMFQVTLENVEAFWRDVTVTSNNSSLIATTWTWASGATAPMNDATYTILGPITNPIIKDMTSGAYIKYAGTVPAAQQLILNADAFVVSGVTLVPNMTLISYWKTGGRLMRLTPSPIGDYLVQLQGTATTAATKLTIAGYKKYQVG